MFARLGAFKPRRGAFGETTNQGDAQIDNNVLSGVFVCAGRKPSVKDIGTEC